MGDLEIITLKFTLILSNDGLPLLLLAEILQMEFIPDVIFAEFRFFIIVWIFVAASGGLFVATVHVDKRVIEKFFFIGVGFIPLALALGLGGLPLFHTFAKELALFNKAHAFCLARGLSALVAHICFEQTLIWVEELTPRLTGIFLAVMLADFFMVG